MSNDAIQQESPKLREARETIYGCYEWNPISRVDTVYERNGRIYYVVSEGRTLTPPQTLIYRFDGLGERDVWVEGRNNGAYMAQPHMKEEEVGCVNQDGSTSWYDADDLAEADHAGDER